MTLPQLAIAAKGRNVHHIVSYSDSLPHKYKRQLVEFAKLHHFIVLDECSESDKPMTPEELARSLIAQGEAALFAEYRVDDDDVLPVDYYGQLAPYLDTPFVGMYVSLGAGLTAIYRNGHFYDVRRCHSPMLAIGLAKICRIGEFGELDAPPVTRHTVADTVAPVILESRRLGFLWARHPDQDTAVSLSFSQSRGELFERARRQIERFPVEENMELVGEQFPTIRNRIHTDPEPGVRQIPLVGARTRLVPQGIHYSIPRLRGRCTFELTIRASTLSPGRDVLLAFQFVDAQGAPISAPDFIETLAERGIIFSSRRKFGFCRWIATRPGLRRDEFSVDLPRGISLTGVTLFPRDGVGARLDLEQFKIIEDQRNRS